MLLSFLGPSSLPLRFPGILLGTERAPSFFLSLSFSFSLFSLSFSFSLSPFFSFSLPFFSISLFLSPSPLSLSLPLFLFLSLFLFLLFQTPYQHAAISASSLKDSIVVSVLCLRALPSILQTNFNSVCFLHFGSLRGWCDAVISSPNKADLVTELALINRTYYVSMVHCVETTQIKK